jgi:hypothetical protein
MNSDDHVDNIIMNLKIIGMVPKNGRLCIKKGSLTLEHDDQMQKIRRWFNKDSRESTMLHIRNTIMNATKLTKGVVSKQIDIELKDWVLTRIFTEMTNCQSGLTNLKTTYNDDSIMIANIDVLLERLQANCEELHIYLEGIKKNV